MKRSRGINVTSVRFSATERLIERMIELWDDGNNSVELLDWRFIDDERNGKAKAVHVVWAYGAAEIGTRNEHNGPSDGEGRFTKVFQNAVREVANPRLYWKDRVELIKRVELEDDEHIEVEVETVPATTIVEVHVKVTTA